MAAAEKVAGTFPCGQQMCKYGYTRTAGCTLCQQKYETCGSSGNGELPREDIGHIQSAGCLGQREVLHTMHAFGSYYLKSMCTGKRAGT